MSHALGVYYAPEHSYKVDRDYIAALQPHVIRILDPDVQHIADMHALAPNAIIAPRTWAIDDNDGAAVRNLMADPIATGRDHAQQYKGQWDRWQQEATQRGLRLPPADRILFNSANEPNQGGTPDKIAAYCVAFLDRCTELGIRACGPCLGVGWPDNNGPDTPVDWSPYANAGLEQAIRRNGGMLSVHEYFYKSGPQDGWLWWAGRHLQCPFDVPILLGEIGIDNYVDKERWTNEGGNRGWQGNVSPDQYAEMIERHIRGCDARVKAALIFITDFRNNAWESFNTRPAHDALLARKDRMIPQSSPATTPPIDTHLPSIGTGTQPDDRWQRSREFVRRWEGGWADNLNDPGGATNKGITLGTFQRWRIARGLPEPTKDDLRAISDEEANRIFYEWYWLESGSDQLPWPLCLAHFDTAVNAGPGRAAEMMQKSGGNFLAYMGHLMTWYTQISNFEVFGRAWIRRRAEILLEAAK